MKEQMTGVVAAEAVREETVKTEGTAVAEKKKETEENGRVSVELSRSQATQWRRRRTEL